MKKLELKQIGNITYLKAWRTPYGWNSFRSHHYSFI